MVSVTPADLLRYRLTVNKTLTAKATNSRTGALLNYRASARGRAIGLPGVPDWTQVRRWSLYLPDGTDLQVGDRLSDATTHGTYGVTQIDRNTLSVATNAYGVLFEAVGTASTTRSADTWSDPAVGIADGSQLPTITLRSLSAELLSPLSSHFMLDTFGVAVEQIAYCLADIPAGSAAFPVRPQDKLSLGGKTYRVYAVQTEPAWLVVYLEVPLNA